MKRRLLLVAMLFAFTGFAANAHPWQDGAVPLTSDAVENVLTALTALGTEATSSGWQPPEGARASLVAAINIYAAEFSAFNRFPEGTQRAMGTYQALEGGALSADGAITEGVDVFTLLQAVHPDDAAAVATKLAEFRIVAELFGVEVR